MSFPNNLFRHCLSLIREVFFTIVNVGKCFIIQASHVIFRPCFAVETELLRLSITIQVRKICEPKQKNSKAKNTQVLQ